MIWLRLCFLHQQPIQIADLKKQINDLSGVRNGSSQEVEESESSHSNISSTGSKEIFKIRQIEKSKKDNLEVEALFRFKIHIWSYAARYDILFLTLSTQKLTNNLKNLEDELTSQKQKYEAVKARFVLSLLKNLFMD